MLALLLPLARKIVPPSLRGPLASILPISAARDMKYYTDVVTHKSRELYRSREHELEQIDEGATPQAGETQDLMSILREFCPSPTVSAVLKVCDVVKANVSSSEDDAVPEEELIAQIS